MYGAVSDLPMSYTARMFGWLSAHVARASCSRRSTCSALCSPGGSTLIATSRPACDRARRTRGPCPAPDFAVQAVALVDPELRRLPGRCGEAAVSRGGEARSSSISRASASSLPRSSASHAARISPSSSTAWRRDPVIGDPDSKIVPSDEFLRGRGSGQACPDGRASAKPPGVGVFSPNGVCHGLWSVEPSQHHQSICSANPSRAIARCPAARHARRPPLRPRHPTTARADAVHDWNTIAVNTAIANGQNPFTQARFAAIAQLAVFEAVNAITNGYESYLGSIEATARASADAAAIAAAHRVLSTYFTASAAALDAARATSLAVIPDGAAKDEGIATGEAAAAAMIGLRTNDGSTPPLFKVPGPVAPGEWQATPNCRSSVVSPSEHFFIGKTCCRSGSPALRHSCRHPRQR